MYKYDPDPFDKKTEIEKEYDKGFRDGTNLYEKHLQKAIEIYIKLKNI